MRGHAFREANRYTYLLTYSAVCYTFNAMYRPLEYIACIIELISSNLCVMHSIPDCEAAEAHRRNCQQGELHGGTDAHQVVTL